jgi:hypothetical protein
VQGVPARPPRRGSQIAIEIQSLAQTIRVTNQMLAGSLRHRAGTRDRHSSPGRAPEDTEKAVADLLHESRRPICSSGRR